MTDPVIRIVDDDPHMHDALQFVLESEGYSVRHFFSAEDFLAGDFLSDPGCAVLDVRMGKMSGLVLQRVLKEREVALLAGQKLTNRQIAERLELAVRTVEFHRAGAMRKLGTHSAKELTEKLIAAGALGS